MKELKPTVISPKIMLAKKLLALCDIADPDGECTRRDGFISLSRELAKQVLTEWNTRNQWINVDERLPEKDTEIVLTLCLDDVSDLGYPYEPNQAMDICFYSNGYWWLEAWPEQAKEDNIVADVTHWMPLPEPPEDK